MGRPRRAYGFCCLRRISQVAVVAAVLSCILPDGTRAEPPPPPPTTQEVAQAGGGDNRNRLNLREPLILELRLGQLILTDAFPALLSGSSLELPLGDLAHILDFAITADPQAGLAGGWFIDEKRLFSLSLGRGEAIIAGRTRRFDKALVHVVDGDIYIDVRLLSQWFPIDIAFDLPNLTATITSREPLPLEARLAREEARDRALSRQGPGKEYPKLDQPPGMASIPRFDLYAQAARATNGSSQRKLTYNYNLTGAADLAGTDASLFVAGAAGQAVSDIRTTFERTDLDGKLGESLLGDYGATQIRGGDIYTPQYALSTRNQVVNGATITNFPVGGSPDEFDRITLTGDLPLGWEMEVYRNETLIDFAEARSDGRYEFTDVPLLFGVNVLRLVFYGPQGQVREETRQVRVGLDQIKPGEVKYEFSAGLHDDRLISNQVVSGTDARRDQARVMTRFQTGINKNLSVGANVVAVPNSDGGRDTYVGTTLATSFGNLFSKLDLVNQKDGGWATRMIAQTSILGFSTILEHNITRNFVSEQFTGTGDSKLNSSTTLRIDGAIALFDLPQMPISLTFDHDRFVNGDRTSTVSSRTTVPIGRLSVTHTFDYSQSKTSSGTSKTGSGTILLGGRIGDVRLRGTVGYDLLPTKDYGAITMTAEKRISKNLEVRLGLDRSAPPSPVNTYSFGLNKLTEWSAWGLDLQYSDDAVFEARVNMAMSFGVNPVTNRPIVQAERTATQGALLSRVFVDHNGNGIFDEGDAPIEGAKLEIDRGIRRVASDADGFLYIPAVTPNRRMVVKVDRDSLKDPFLVPVKEGVAMVANPGGTVRLDFPVVTTGEIDGTVFKVEDSRVFPVSGAEIQLFDGDGNLVKELRSAFDGFYLLEFLPPGEYTVRIDPDQLARLGLTADRVHRLTIDGDGTVLNARDFLLRKIGEDAPASGDAPSSSLPTPSEFAEPSAVPSAAPPPSASSAPAAAPSGTAPSDGPPVPDAAPVIPVTPAPN